ncbi:MAG: hypothetical protein OXI43_15745 [Candidatus Poribacteria bacterium]|nr:hypothetical protein [Candidatus Poribacteria bacterium]
MLENIKILLKADCLGWLNSLKHDKQAWRKSVLKGIGYLIFIVALSVMGYSLFMHLRSTDAPPPLLLSVINGFMVFGIIVVAKELMESSLKILYEAPDSALLHAAPIKPVAIFAYKFIHIIATRFLSMLCFLGPPWIAFGIIFELPRYFYIVLFPVSVCLLVLIASYVTISVMVIVRFFSSAGLLATLKVIGTAIGVAVGFLLSFSLFAGSDAVPIKRFILDWASTKTGSAAATWYPHEWIGKFLLSWTTEATLWIRLRWVFGGLGISLVSIGLAVLTAQGIYQHGWEKIRQLKTKRKPARNNNHPTASNLSSTFVILGRGKVQSLMLKDFLIFIKHSGRVIAIVMLTFFLAIHIGVLFASGSGTDENAAKILTVQVLLYSLLITFGMSCNGLRDEAKTWWMLKSAPVTPNLIFTSKFLTTLLCALIYAEFWSLTAVILLGIPTHNWVPVLLTPIITLPVACALNTMIGTLPWMAELTHQPKPILRVLTFTVTLFIDMVCVIAPIIAWWTKNIAIFFVLIILLVGVFVMSYRSGIGNLRKLLVAQV